MFGFCLSVVPRSLGKFHPTFDANSSAGTCRRERKVAIETCNLPGEQERQSRFRIKHLISSSPKAQRLKNK